MTIPGNLLTTAMAVMPHMDGNQALKTALSLDIPFWPQLPNYNYYEDMYVQAAEHFPGILLDMENKTLRFSMDKFIAEFEETMALFDDPGYFDVSSIYSVVYHRFLDMDLSDRPAIRGQLEGPVSFGFNVLDQDDRQRDRRQWFFLGPFGTPGRLEGYITKADRYNCRPGRFTMLGGDFHLQLAPRGGGRHRVARTTIPVAKRSASTNSSDTSAARTQTLITCTPASHV